jgi:hypothetical protein
MPNKPKVSSSFLPPFQVLGFAHNPIGVMVLATILSLEQDLCHSCNIQMILNDNDGVQV